MLKAVAWEHLQRGETRLVYPFTTTTVSCEFYKKKKKNQSTDMTFDLTVSLKM